MLSFTTGTKISLQVPKGRGGGQKAAGFNDFSGSDSPDRVKKKGAGNALVSAALHTLAGNKPPPMQIKRHRADKRAARRETRAPNRSGASIKKLI